MVEGKQNITEQKIRDILKDIPDPEIPVITIAEMGIIREVIILEYSVIVQITPTYSGCPAMKSIEDDIIAELRNNGIENVTVKKVYSPAWTTDWLTENAKRKLKEYGIAPPGKTDENSFDDLFTKKIECPFCGSKNTELTSAFGSTACKSLHFCQNCTQPFEHFKCI